jgi:hypothetical protein
MITVAVFWSSVIGGEGEEGSRRGEQERGAGERSLSHT